MNRNSLINAGLLLMSLGSTACRAVTSVGGGTQPGEFYVTVTRSYLIYFVKSHVLHCQEHENGQVTCYRILQAREIDQFNFPKGEYYLRSCKKAGKIDGSTFAPMRTEMEGTILGLPPNLAIECQGHYTEGFTEGSLQACYVLGIGDAEEDRSLGTGLGPVLARLPEELRRGCEDAYKRAFEGKEDY